MNQQSNTKPAWFKQALAAPGESRYFEHEGTLLHYLAWDKDGDGKPAVILIHGYRGHARWWAFTAPFLADRFRVYSLDLSGMGDSGHRAFYDNRTHAPEILALAGQVGNEPVYAVGHSFGGGRLMRASALDPAAFKKIIIVDSKMFFRGDVPNESPIPGKQRIYPDLATAKTRFRLSPPQDWSDPWLVDYVAETSLKQTPEGWTWKFDPNLWVKDHYSPYGEELVPQITVETDMVYGDLSGVVSTESVQRTHNALPNPGRLVRIPGGYHHLMLSDATVLIAVLQALL